MFSKSRILTSEVLNGLNNFGFCCERDPLRCLGSSGPRLSIIDKKASCKQGFFERKRDVGSKPKKKAAGFLKQNTTV
jgi:hypothetical protein